MDTSQRDTPAAESYIGYALDIGLVAIAQVTVALLQFLRLPILTKWLGAELS